MLAQTKTAEPRVVNGINVDDLSALIDRVKRDAAKGQTHWRGRARRTFGRKSMVSKSAESRSRVGSR